MSQIFKYEIPSAILFDILDIICIKNNNYYFFNTIAYKKGLIDNRIANFLDKCKPFYHKSKQSYLEKKLTYNMFTTVLRQICKYNKISFISKIKYGRSCYEIQYFVYF